jgi:exodeoxyribonuclease V beta subunit
MRRAAEQGEENDALTIRLEDDGDLVRVITVHKSKGLEYPLVFLPYAVAFRPVAPDAQPLVWHDAAFKRCVSLVPDAAGHAHADRERLGEDLRKLYVALTRARYATWIGCAPIANVTSSAFGYLVSRGQEREDQLSWATILAAWQAGHPHIAVQTVAQPSLARYQQETMPWHTRRARVMQRAVRDAWEIVSYSSLSAVSTSAEGGMAESATAAIFLERPSPTLKDLSVTRSSIEGGVAAGELHHFPAGAGAGTFLHELLNWSAMQGFQVIANQRDVVCDAIAHRSRAHPGWSAWVETLADWLQDFVTREMQVPNIAASQGRALTLSALTTYFAEMEFWLGVSAMQVGQLDRIVRSHTLAGAARPALAFAQVHGMLKGFIDLVFEHQGRYYILDYKSNWLGPNNDAYTPAAMRQAVLGHRYELQYALYLFALHRLLRARLTDYDYDRHIGGALYVFLRGTRAASGGLFFERPPLAMMHALDRLVGVAGHRAAI